MSARLLILVACCVALEAFAAPAGPSKKNAPSAPAAAAQAPATAQARVLPARETAHVLERAGDWSVGVFNPLTVALGNGFELRGHPLLFLVSPNAVLRKEHATLGAWTITGEYGLSVPSFLFRLTRGYLFETNATVPWQLVPRVGAVATLGETTGSPWTLSADVAVGVTLGRGELTNRYTYAPLEVLLAPALGGYRVRAGAAYDHAFNGWLRGRGYADLYVHGSTTGPQLTGRVGVGVDLAVFSRGRVTLGAVWWNSNQQAVNPESFERVRSNDLYPTLDFIWGG